ncbi:MATE family efflux transporter [Paenibacillus sp. TRM 82003]|nr:MATE family efflux transporter [Paenibacillus sp. TRM 82003]
MTIQQQRQSLSLWHLAWPLAVEMLLQFLMGTVDSLMVSSLGDHEVSAVGVSNQVVMSLMTIFFLVNSGAAVVVARRWGGGDAEAARRTSAMALKLNAYAGIAISLFLFAKADAVLTMMSCPPEVLPHAAAYLRIVGAGMIAAVLHMTLSAVIRSTGNTRDPMLVSVGMNALHLALNYGFLFGAFGLPELGVEGVAISTVISRFVALGFCGWLLLRTFGVRAFIPAWRGYDKLLLRDMMSVGLPSIFTSVSWGASQMAIVTIVSSLGAMPLAAFTYVNLIQQLPFMLGQAFGMAVQIQVGQHAGAERFEAAYRAPYAGAKIGMLASLGAALLIAASARGVLGWFTDDAAIVEAAMPIFLLCLVWQPMRIWTFTVTGALTAVGEARFVAVISVLGMWLTTTAGAYAFGVWAGFGLIGVFVAYFLDETFRAIAAGLRWKRRRKLPVSESTSTRYNRRETTLFDKV